MRDFCAARTRTPTRIHPGYTRVPDELGFAYRDTSGAPITDAETLTRIRALAIPPAWRDVWISPDPLGHLQAMGVDAAGRRQYLYHELWREQEDQLKFEHMERSRARFRACASHS